MTDLELIFTMLGERVTTEISKNEKPETLEKNRRVAKLGGSARQGEAYPEEEGFNGIENARIYEPPEHRDGKRILLDRTKRNV